MNKRQKKKKYKLYVKDVLKQDYNSVIKKGGKIIVDSSGSIYIRE